MTPSRWDWLKNNQPVLAAVFLLPTLLVLVSVVVYPFLSAVWISFQAKQAGTPGRFIGLQNYAELLGNPVFLRIVGNTVVYTGVAVALKFALGLAAALVLAPTRPLNAVYRTVLFVPWAVPTVIAALNWRWVYDEFSGMLNNVLLALGVTKNVVAWLAEPQLGSGRAEPAASGRFAIGGAKSTTWPSSWSQRTRPPRSCCGLHRPPTLRSRSLALRPSWRASGSRGFAVLMAASSNPCSSAVARCGLTSACTRRWRHVRGATIDRRVPASSQVKHDVGRFRVWT
jgi:hypothetical protein